MKDFQVAFRTTIVALFLIAAGANAQTAVVHVDGDNGVHNPPNFGQDGWGIEAYKFLQDALQGAFILIITQQADTVEVWVAQTDPLNPYRTDRDAANPGGTNDPAASFSLLDKVALFGGFPPGGGDGTFGARDPDQFITVLSGDIGATAQAGINSFHVVKALVVDDSAVLDGLRSPMGRPSTWTPKVIRGAGECSSPRRVRGLLVAYSLATLPLYEGREYSSEVVSPCQPGPLLFAVVSLETK